MAYYSCEICGVKSIGVVDYESHIRGTRHVNKVEEAVRKEKYPWQKNLANYFCQVCDEEFHSASAYADHLSDKHPQVEVHPLAEFPRRAAYSCEICGVRAIGLTDYESHIRGARHLNRVRSAVVEERGSLETNEYAQYICRLCNATFDYAILYERHLATEHPRPETMEIPKNDEYGQQYGNKILCTLCNVIMPGPISYEQHLQGRLHTSSVLQKQSHDIGDPSQNSLSFPGRERPRWYNFFSHCGATYQRFPSSHPPRLRPPIPYCGQPCHQGPQQPWAPPNLRNTNPEWMHSIQNFYEFSRGCYRCRMCGTYHRNLELFKGHLSDTHKNVFLPK